MTVPRSHSACLVSYTCVFGRSQPSHTTADVGGGGDHHGRGGGGERESGTGSVSQSAAVCFLDARVVLLSYSVDALVGLPPVLLCQVAYIYVCVCVDAFGNSNDGSFP